MNLKGMLFLCGALALLSSSCRTEPTAPRVTDVAGSSTTHPFVIRDARVFDGERVIDRGDVWVADGHVRAVGAHLQVPKGTLSIDATGMTLLPGLIDSHVHSMGSVEFLKSALAMGVTTEYDMGAAPQFAYKVVRDQAAGLDVDMTDLRTAGTQPTAPYGHGTEYGHRVPTLSTPAEAQPFVDARIAEGADFIGEIEYDDGSEFGLHLPTLNKPTLRAVIEAAHARGKLAVVHVLSLDAAKDALDCGADGLAHLFADRAPDTAFAGLAARHHAFVIPTLSLLASMAGRSGGPAISRDPAYEPFLSTEAIADLNSSLPRPVGSFEYTKQAVRMLKAQGTPILAGTDAHNPGTAHGASLQDELRLLVEAGLTPREALASATSVNARAFRLEDRGRIAPGMRADLLLVDGDPTTNIDDVKHVVAVWKLGVTFDRDAYRASLVAEKAAEVAARMSPGPRGSDSGLISDFEDGTAGAQFGLGWRVSSGVLLGGVPPTAKIAIVGGGAEGSAKAMEISGEIQAGVFGWAGAMFFPGPIPMAPVNLSNKPVISFWTRGDGRRYQVFLHSRRKGAMPSVRTFVAGPAWNRISIPFADFGTDGADLEAIVIGVLGTPGPFRLRVDDIRLDLPAAIKSSEDSAASLHAKASQ